MTVDEHLWWYLSRASGITAWLLVTASVLWGMALSTKALGARPKGPWLADLHRFLGGLAVAFTGIHMVALWADSWTPFGLRELLVPFASTWKPGAVAVGVVAFWLLLAVEATSLAMRRLPRHWWRWVHLASYALYALASIHLLAAGTDAANPLLKVAVGASAGAVVFFTTYLAIGPSRRPAVRRPQQPSDLGPVDVQ